MLVATLFYVGDADRAAKDQRVKTYPPATSVLGLMYIVMAVVSILATAHERAADQPKSLVAVRADTPPTIDGVLDDAVWAYAAVGSGLVQHDPDDGEPASEETTFQVSYDDDTLYIGVMCSDSNPGGLLFNDLKQVCSLTDGNLSRHLETISIGGVELDSVPDAGPDEHTRELEQTGVVLRLHLVPRLDSPVFR